MRGIFAVKKDDRLIASNARSDLLGKNYTRTRNSSLAKSFWCYLLSAQKVAKTLQTRFNALILRYFCLTKVTKNNPDDENLLRSPSEIGKRATARFCEQNIPVSFPISVVARLTHFHRSGTWLLPTDISQTFLLNCLKIKYKFFLILLNFFNFV